MAGEFGWWPMSAWLTPAAAWFIFFNVLVGAVALMSSRPGRQDESATRRKLVRTASTVVLDALRSISIFSVHSTSDYGAFACSSSPASQLRHVQDQHHTFQEQATQEVAPELREPEAASVAQEEISAVAPPGAVSQSQVEDGEPSISLDEAYALVRARRHSPTAAAADTMEPEKRKPVAETKVRTYGRGRGTAEAEVNERAEQFIRQFREDLKLERINSILNYTHALRRGAGPAAAER